MLFAHGRSAEELARVGDLCRCGVEVEYIGHRMAFDGFQGSGLGDVSRLKHSSLEERSHLRHGWGVTRFRFGDREPCSSGSSLRESKRVYRSSRCAFRPAAVLRSALTGYLGRLK